MRHKNKSCASSSLPLMYCDAYASSSDIPSTIYYTNSLTVLASTGCDSILGYAFAHAKPTSEFARGSVFGLIV